MELEVFVQGAMCMTYSGRCLLGDYMGGRPGNKGECNHACRFKYKVWLEEERRPGKFFQLDQGEDGTHFIMSSRDLCTINRLAEILPYVDAMKIEGRSKSEFYVGGMVKAYKHVRDAIIDGTPIDPEIQNLVNIIPHREYRDGFLFNNIKDFPERENEDFARENSEQNTKNQEQNLTSDHDLPLDHENHNAELPNFEIDPSITQSCAGPLFARNYFGQVALETLEVDGQIFHKFTPKEVVEIGMQLHYLTPSSYGKLTITGICNAQGKPLERGTCNTPNIYITTNIELHGEELLYIHPQQ